MSGDWLDRLNGLDERDKHYALCWIHGFDPEVFDRAVEHVAPKPLRIPEPKGLGAVVEDSAHRLWVRVSNTPGTFPWLRGGEGVRGWSEFDAVRVLSEGVES